MDDNIIWALVGALNITNPTTVNQMLAVAHNAAMSKSLMRIHWSDTEVRAQWLGSSEGYSGYLVTVTPPPTSGFAQAEITNFKGMPRE